MNFEVNGNLIYGKQYTIYGILKKYSNHALKIPGSTSNFSKRFSDYGTVEMKSREEKIQK
jgi:hypothetical protein